MIDVRGVVFDFDGVLADTLVAHSTARIEAFKSFGYTTDVTIHAAAHHHGSHPHEIIGWVLKETGVIPASADVSTDPIVQQVVDKKNEIYRLHAAQGLEPIPGAIDLIARCSEVYGEANVAIATTASTEHEVVPFLKKYNLESVAKVIVGKELTPAGQLKPDPFVYTLVANMLGVTPELLAAIEDSPLGIAAAKAAGLQVIGVATTHKQGDLAAADVVVADLSMVAAILSLLV